METDRNSALLMHTGHRRDLIWRECVRLSVLLEVGIDDGRKEALHRRHVSLPIELDVDRVGARDLLALGDLVAKVLHVALVAMRCHLNHSPSFVGWVKQSWRGRRGYDRCDSIVDIVTGKCDPLRPR